LETRELCGRIERNEKSILRVTRWMLDQGILELNGASMLIMKEGEGI
jgi:hypothetical protein